VDEDHSERAPPAARPVSPGRAAEPVPCIDL